MTIVTNWYPDDGKLGANLNSPITISSTSNPDYPAAPFALGERLQGNNGSEWIYVQCSTTCAPYDLVVIDNAFKANPATSALVASNVYALGIAEFQATLGGASQTANALDYFWALLKANGGVAVNVSPSAGRGVALFIASTAGKITSSVTSNRLNNISLVASIGTSASGPGEAVIFSYIQPQLNLTGVSV